MILLSISEQVFGSFLKIVTQHIAHVFLLQNEETCFWFVEAKLNFETT